MTYILELGLTTGAMIATFVWGLATTGSLTFNHPKKDVKLRVEEPPNENLFAEWDKQYNKMHGAIGTRVSDVAPQHGDILVSSGSGCDFYLIPSSRGTSGGGPM